MVLDAFNMLCSLVLLAVLILCMTSLQNR